MKAALNHLWRVTLAAVLLSAISSGSFWLLKAYKDFPPADVPWIVTMGWLVFSRFLTAGVLAYPAVRSRWAGTQLVCAIFVVYFGVHTFINISQGFLLTPGIMTSQRAAVLTAHGFLVALVFSFGLVLLMGCMWRPGAVTESSRLHLPPGEWLWKLGVSAAACVVLHVLAWELAWPRVGEFYLQQGLAPWWERVILETGRALLLVAFVLPVIKMMEGGRLETAVTVGLLFCVLGDVTPFMLPTALLPGAVRFALMATRGVSDLVCGLLVGYLLSRQPGQV